MTIIIPSSPFEGVYYNDRGRIPPSMDPPCNLCHFVQLLPWTLTLFSKNLFANEHWKICEVSSSPSNRNNVITQKLSNATSRNSQNGSKVLTLFGVKGYREVSAIPLLFLSFLLSSSSLPFDPYSWALGKAHFLKRIFAILGAGNPSTFSGRTVLAGYTALSEKTAMRRTWERFQQAPHTFKPICP